MPTHRNPPLQTRYVFVYGTLRQGEANDITKLRPEPQFMGRASVPGCMYHLGGYPGVTLGGAGRIKGEVYAISPALEQQLDEIEELYPQQRDEYFKQLIEVDFDGRSLTCIFYEINPKYLTGCPEIASGDWVLSGTIGPG